MAIEIGVMKTIIKELEKTKASLVAVSKTRSHEEIQALYQLGQIDFGENKVQELTQKKEILPKDIRWHFIGHLQTNKVKYISDFIYMIQSVDSLKLLDEIEKRAKESNRKIHFLLQIHIAKEESKYGITPEDVFDFIKLFLEKEYKQVICRGLMGMATHTTDIGLIEKEFQLLSTLFHKIKGMEEFKNNFDTLSMGMSEDYKIALQYGANMVRMGSALFKQ
jgi:pyridoxal phosphate enzyme (YggS family)